MKEQRITIEIDREGKVTADAEGFSGDACLADLTRLLEGMASERERADRKPQSGGARVAEARTVSAGAGRKP